MATNPSAEWWSDDLRGKTVQHVLARPRHSTHVMELTISGPGALHRRALCGGLQPTVIVNSGLDTSNEQECKEWLNSYTGVLASRGVAPGSNVLASANEYTRQTLCTRCAERYAKVLERSQ